MKRRCKCAREFIVNDLNILSDKQYKYTTYFHTPAIFTASAAAAWAALTCSSMDLFSALRSSTCSASVSASAPLAIVSKLRGVRVFLVSVIIKPGDRSRDGCLLQDGKLFLLFNTRFKILFCKVKIAFF